MTDSPVVRTSSGDPVALIIEQWQQQRPDLDPSPMSIFGRIARVFALQRRRQAAVHDSYGLSHAAFDLLANLRRSGPPYRKTASDIAESSMISTGGVTFRMDGLENAGLIRRVRDTEDRRVVYAELTAKGLEVIDRAIEDHVQLLAAMLGSLKATEQRQLSNLLGKLEASIAANPWPAEPSGEDEG